MVVNGNFKQHKGGRDGQPPEMGSEMEHRLTVLETRLDATLPSIATKADIGDTKSDLIKWVAGTMIAGIAIIISFMTFLISRIEIKPSLQQPVIINIPHIPSSAGNSDGVVNIPSNNKVAKESSR